MGFYSAHNKDEETGTPSVAEETDNISDKYSLTPHINTHTLPAIDVAYAWP